MGNLKCDTKISLRFVRKSIFMNHNYDGQLYCIQNPKMYLLFWCKLVYNTDNKQKKFCQKLIYRMVTNITKLF